MPSTKASVAAQSQTSNENAGSNFPQRQNKGKWSKQFRCEEAAMVVSGELLVSF